MKKRIEVILFPFVYFAFLSAMPAIADICDVYPPKGTKPVFTYIDTYINGAWGYSVDIPKRYEGRLYQDPHAPQHGIQVILKWEPRSTVYFNGEANSIEDEETGKPLNAVQHCLFRFTTVSKHAREIQSFELHKSRLGTHEALAYIVRYICPGSSETRVEETVLAIPPERSLVYSVTLETTQNSYTNDRKIFQQFISR